MSGEHKEQIKKDMDGWVEVCIVDPITYPLVPLLGKYVSQNALFYTFLSFSCGVLASVFLLLGYPPYIAGILYFLSVIWDGLDGKIARYYGKQVFIHGLLDITTDVLKNLLLMVSIYLVFPEYHLWVLAFVVLLLFYEYTYAIRVGTRLLLGKDESLKDKYSMVELKESYEKKIEGLNSSVLKFLLRIYNVGFSITSKFRTYPYPTLIDGEFMLFVVFLIFGHKILLVLAVLFLIPDTLISFILTVLLGFTNADKKV